MPASDPEHSAGNAGPDPAALAIVGITRYSVIFQRSFAATRGLDEDRARAVIWDPRRLAHRRRLFEALTLPSLDQLAARHAGFHHIVMLSTGFPEAFRLVLDETALTRPWLHLVEAEPGSDFSVVKPKLAQIVGDRAAYVFRIDDDDALAPAAFLAAIVAHANSAPGTVLSPDEGWMVRPAWRGVSLRPTRIPFVSAGLGLYTRGPSPQSIHDLGNQNKIDRPGQAVIHARGRLWLRTKHYSSDTVMQAWKRWRYWPTAMTTLRGMLAAEFPGLDADRIIGAVTGAPE
jgi:hypothetical protein